MGQQLFGDGRALCSGYDVGGYVDIINIIIMIMIGIVLFLWIMMI